jgi:hypothetical protein
LESQYRYRKADRLCPYCGRPTIIKGRAEYGGGWLCYQRKGGCGAKFADQDVAIVSQAAGRMENADLADTYNTVLKMAKKRTLVDATLTATAASDIFNQDLEDYTPPEVAAAVQSGTIPPQPSISTGVRQPQSSASAASNRVLTKGQLEILLLSQRRSKVSEAELKQYVAETYHVSELKDLKQKDLNTILEWLETQHGRRIDAAERQAMVVEN